MLNDVSKTHTERIYLVSFSPDGKLALTTSQHMARLWNVADGLPIGLSIIGARGSDASLVAVARAFEASK